MEAEEPGFEDPLDPALAAELIPPSPETPFEARVRADVNRALSAQLITLSAKQREVILRRFLFGQTLADVGVAFRVSRECIRLHEQKALYLLRRGSMILPLRLAVYGGLEPPPTDPHDAQERARQEAQRSAKLLALQTARQVDVALYKAQREEQKKRKRQERALLRRLIRYAIKAAQEGTAAWRVFVGELPPEELGLMNREFKTVKRGLQQVGIDLAPRSP